MNSRSSVNESNLVNLSANLSTLDPLDAKDSLSLSFPFDHIYACHSEGSDRRQTLSLDKDVEISTHCVVTDQKDLVVSTSSEINRLSERLSAAENQNKKLKDLLIYHLDLIQQQNDVITKREKLYQSLKQENDTLKGKVNRMEKKLQQDSNKHKHTANASSSSTKQQPAPPVVPPAVIKTEPGTSQAMFNTLEEILIPDPRTQYLYNDVSKPKLLATDPFDLNRTGPDSDVPSYFSSDLGVGPVVPSILEDSIPVENLTMIENKRSTYMKKEIKTEPRQEAMYTVTSNSGNPVIHKVQRNRRRTSCGIGSLNRMPKTPAVKAEPPPDPALKMYDDDKAFERNYSVNKKSKMINTYGKSKTTTTPKRTSHYTGSLTDRLQLIDTTPTGEDPYQLGEADMREQSPIPKLMLQKTNHGRMKICSDAMGDGLPTIRRPIYDAPATETTTKSATKIKLENRYNLPSTVTHTEVENSAPLPWPENNVPQRSRIQEVAVKKETSEPPPSPNLFEPKTSMVFEPDLDMVKTEPAIDWRLNSSSMCSFDCTDADQPLPRINPDDFQRYLYTESSEEANTAVEALENLDLQTLELCTKVAEQGDDSEQTSAECPVGITPDVVPETVPYVVPAKRGTESKRGRKRALSTTGLMKTGRQPKGTTAPKAKQPKGKDDDETGAANRGKKSPVPGMKSRKPYYTSVGDPDVSWYYGLDPEVKMEDINQPGTSAVSTVEVPRWREKPYTSCYTLEGTENLDDKVFEKRHQKLEAEERRQLRWHMRRIREQRHVERLRQRQRDSWCSGLTSPAYQQPSVYTIWPQPQRDVRIIEITDTLPVMAFGEDLPELPPADFMLPWVRTSKALKRSKRSKTLH